MPERALYLSSGRSASSRRLATCTPRASPTTADPDTPYMYHRHLLQHEDSGMMGQFVVVETTRKHVHRPTPTTS